MFCCRIRDDTRSAGLGGSRHWRCVEGLFCCAARGSRVARRVGCPILFGGGASRTTLATSLREATFGRSILPTREGCSPAPDGAPPIAAPAGRPKGRWILVRESSPYSSLLGRCPIGRGVLGRRSRFPTALQPPNPRRGACARKVPTWRLNCRCPSARRRWRWAFRLPNEFPWAFHPRARLVRPCSS